MEDLQKYLIKSASDYFEYLDKNNLGLDEIKILDARLLGNDTLLLSLENNLITMDFLQLYIYGILIDIDLAEKKSFNDLTRTLELKFGQNILNNIARELNITLDNPSSLISIFADTKIHENIELFVDLKFLVKNIQTFCEQESLNLNLPTTKPLAFSLPFESHISNEQKQAIKGIFTHPISYIWGISGSGKTQIVLLYALLNIIAQNKKALILAPTNTALEQIFTSLIMQCDKRGIRRQRFIRLGMPSAEFLQKFPDVCESSDEEEITNQLFKAPTLKERLQECFVIGITLDSYAKRHQIFDKLEFAHIFLDECAFSPLIKIIPPLHLNVPLTLLGDHKQLMPICLMDDKKITESYHEISLWNLNTLFLEEFFDSYQALYKRHNYEDIEFKNIAHFKLTTTHRYGNNLAQILNHHVYFNGLSGMGLPTQIYYIDSTQFGRTYQHGDERNESQAEAKAISSMLTKARLKDYAVLTPFRHQQQLIIKHGNIRTKVFTIHKSQGKEFDTIIFSPVKFSRYLTDSTNKAALFALNVAISRLRKELIIVCDYHLWLKKKGQFLCSLLQIAKPYPLVFPQTYDLPF